MIQWEMESQEIPGLESYDDVRGEDIFVREKIRYLLKIESNISWSKN